MVLLPYPFESNYRNWITHKVPPTSGPTIVPQKDISPLWFVNEDPRHGTRGTIEWSKRYKIKSLKCIRINEPTTWVIILQKITHNLITNAWDRCMSLTNQKNNCAHQLNHSCEGVLIPSYLLSNWRIVFRLSFLSHKRSKHLPQHICLFYLHI